MINISALIYKHYNKEKNKQEIYVFTKLHWNKYYFWDFFLWLFDEYDTHNKYIYIYNKYVYIIFNKKYIYTQINRKYWY